MFLLRTLGTVQLVRISATGEEPEPTHAKRLALLLFLARGGRGLLRRDVLLGLLWPDSDQTHGRGALRQALSGLRRQLGPDTIVTQGEEEVGLSAGVLTCDATEFEQASGAGRHAEACRLYHGDFAAGFHVTGLSPEFDQWVEVERTRLRHLALRSAGSAADQAEREGRPADGVTLVRRAIQLAPDDEASVVHLIGLLDRMGDRSAALAAYQVFERHLATEYSATPSPETRARIAAVRNRIDPRQAPPVTAERPAPEPSAGPPGGRPPDRAVVIPPRTVRRSRRRLMLAGAIGALVTAGFVAALAWVRQPSARSPGLIAVHPFRVGAADSTLHWLGEGMVDLLSIRLSGVEGLEVAQPGRSLPAGRVVQGSVSGTRSGVVLTAWIQTVPEGRTVARASVTGPPDSLQTLIDRLAIQLIGQSAGIEANQLGSVTSTSLPAIRAFLAGRAAFRTGRMEEAVQRFLEAVEVDSDFALAALDLYRTTRWVNGGPNAAIGERRAAAGRDRLIPADRALLDALREQRINTTRMFAGWNLVTTTYPDRPENWYGLGEAYFHWGQLAGIEGSLESAEDAFRRGWQLDSAAEIRSALFPSPLVAEPMIHMVELAHIRGDTSEVRRLAARVTAADSTSALARTLTWHLAMMDGDSARRVFWDGIGTASQRTTMWIALFISSSGLGIEDQPRAGSADKRRLQVQDPGYAGFAAWVTALNGGRPSQVPAIRGDDRFLERKGLRSRIRAAMHWEGDSAEAVAAVRLLTRYVNAPATDANAIKAQEQDICALGQWRMAHGDRRAAEMASRRLHASSLLDLGGNDGVSHLQYVQLCSALLEASLASSRKSPPAARAAIAVADSLARSFIFQICCGEALNDANLLLAELCERAGDLPEALRALRRGSGGFGLAPLYLTSFLREEGRLAALTGDTNAAIQAYRRYLVFRRDPEPSLRPAVERVRRALEALEAVSH